MEMLSLPDKNEVFKDPVLFLDIDGVLNSEQFFHAQSYGFTRRQFCPIASSNLLHVLAAIPALRIVVSSSWRIMHTFIALRDILEKEAGVPPHKVIAVTPVAKRCSTPRGVEIRVWLDHHPLVKQFVIVDDTSDGFESMKERFVKTDYRLGFMFDKAEEAMWKLDLKTICSSCGIPMPGRSGAAGTCRDCGLKAIEYLLNSGTEENSLDDPKSVK